VAPSPAARRLVTAGTALTVVGSAMSVTGTVLYFTTDGDARWTGAGLAAAAEPLMIAGTVLWVVGAMRR
jgi:hypothetical protein